MANRKHSAPMPSASKSQPVGKRSNGSFSPPSSTRRIPATTATYLGKIADAFAVDAELVVVLSCDGPHPRQMSRAPIRG